MKYWITALVSASLLVMSLSWADLPWTFIPTPQVPMAPPRFPMEAEVVGFDPALHAVWFENYRYWPNSDLPIVAQVPHCTGLALLARQAFIHAEFDPTRPALSPAETEKRLKKVYERHSGYLPGETPKVVIPGYADLNELSDDSDMEIVIKLSLIHI